MSEKKNEHRLKDTQLAALVASASIIGFAVIYWGFQIQGVREMLELAYG